jgi:hypothetical protein
MIEIILFDVTIFFLIFLLYECVPKFCVQTFVSIQNFLWVANKMGSHVQCTIAKINSLKVYLGSVWLGVFGGEGRWGNIITELCLVHSFKKGRGREGREREGI